MPCLLFLAALLEGCAAQLVRDPLQAAEDQVASGKALPGDPSQTTAFPSPEMRIRRELVLIMDALQQGTCTYAQAYEGLDRIRKDTAVPYPLRVEAGYLRALVGMLDESARQMQTLHEQCEQCLREKDQAAEEIDLLRYKLKKLEEIYINTEKRRGMQ